MRHATPLPLDEGGFSSPFLAVVALNSCLPSREIALFFFQSTLANTLSVLFPLPGFSFRAPPLQPRPRTHCTARTRRRAKCGCKRSSRRISTRRPIICCCAHACSTEKQVCLELCFSALVLSLTWTESSIAKDCDVICLSSLCCCVVRATGKEREFILPANSKLTVEQRWITPVR